jgi:1-acyl-sn-glycerol-3-phosphate acyltransferase
VRSEPTPDGEPAGSRPASLGVTSERPEGAQAPGQRITVGLVVRSLAFALGQTVATVVFAGAAVLVIPFPYRVRYAVVIRWTDVVLWWLRVTCRLTHEVEGLEHIPGPPAVVLAKHQSAWETLVLPRYFSPQVWVLKRELLWVPFFGWGIATLKPIAIDRRAGREARRQVLEQGQRRLREGLWVVIFPEGTRVAPGERRRYRLGGALLAERTGVPVVPVAHDSGHYWRRRGFLKHPGTIRLVIGPSIATEGRSAAEINRLAEDWIERTVETIRRPG